MVFYLFVDFLEGVDFGWSGVFFYKAGYYFVYLVYICSRGGKIGFDGFF